MCSNLSELREWIKEKGLDSNKALEELQKWDRKYYQFIITTERHIQPGDGITVALTGGGRKVVVGEEDFYEDTDECYQSPTLGEVILAALKMWEEDKTIKNYWAVSHWRLDTPEPEPIENSSKEIMTWKWRYKNKLHGSVEYYLKATSESEALQILQSNVPNYEGKFHIWEVNSNWGHSCI